MELAGEQPSPKEEGELEDGEIDDDNDDDDSPYQESRLVSFSPQRPRPGSSGGGGGLGPKPHRPPGSRHSGQPPASSNGLAYRQYPQGFPA